MERPNQGVLRFQADLNWLRLFCIVSIFLMHAGLSFTYIPQLFDHWYFQSKHANLLLTGFCSFANSACMPLFFLMAGMFAQLKREEGRTGYFQQRILKWAKLFLLVWPLTAVWVIGAHAWVIEHPLDYLSLIFPTAASTDAATILPMNFFHLWFLVGLMFCEGVMIVLRHRLRRILGRGFLIVVLAVQVLTMFIQGRGYLLTPVMLGEKSGLTFLVYLGWYLLGYAIPMSDWVKHLGRLNRRWLWGGLGVGLYFTAKYLLLLYDFQALAVGFQLGLLLCDALLPMSVLLIWFDLMAGSFFLDRVSQNERLNRAKDRVIRYGLWIYFLQIPLIFLVLAAAKKLEIWDLVVLGAEIVPGQLESGRALLNWALLSGIVVGMMAIVLSVTNRIRLKK